MTTPTRRPVSHRFAICVDNAEYPASLELHKVYRILPDKEATRHGDLRVIDESGEDYLYPTECFVPVDLPRQTVKALKKGYARTYQRGG